MEPILNVLFPVFAIIGAGYACGHFRLLGPGSSEALNGFVYWVALPVFLFQAMATVDLSVLFNGAFLGAYIGGLILIWALALVLGRVLFGRGLAEGGMLGMNCVYGNTGYMGIPLAITAFGEAAALPSILATVVNTAVVVGIATALIEIGQQGERAGKAIVADVAVGLLKNPLFVAPMLGCLWAVTGVGLAEPVKAFTSILGAAAGPCALFSIGLFLVGRPVSEGLGEVGLMTAMKLLLQPVLTAILIFYFFPMEPLWAKVAVLMAALPTGSGSFVLAQAYRLYVARTSSVILISTVLSVLTMAVFFAIYPPT
jgi:predicted permease